MIASVSPFEGSCASTAECSKCPVAQQVISRIGEYIGKLPSMGDNEQSINVQIQLEKSLDILSESCLPYISEQIGELYPTPKVESEEIIEVKPLQVERRSEERNAAQNVLTDLIRKAKVEGLHVIDKGVEQDADIAAHEITSAITDTKKEARLRDNAKNRRVHKDELVDIPDKPGTIEI